VLLNVSWQDYPNALLSGSAVKYALHHMQVHVLVNAVIMSAF
jgi:hypothetical protein